MGMARKLSCGMLAGLMVLTAASPAEARHRRDWDTERDDVSAGDVIGAAVLIGGIAAIAGAFKGDRYGARYGAEQKAIRACAREAEDGGIGGARRVRSIEDVERLDGYYFVRGIVEGEGGYRDEEGEAEGFSCTVRGRTIHDFQLSSGRRW